MEVDDPLNILQEELEQHMKEDDQRSLFILLHEITLRFENDRRYRNDTRYIRIWLQYASYFRNAGWIYDHMFEHKIGEYVGAFYEHVAEYYALYRHCHSDAKEIVKLGIQKKAEPSSRLYQALHLIQQQEKQQQKVEPSEGLNNIELLTLLKDRHQGPIITALASNTTAIPSSPPPPSQQIKKKHHDVTITSKRNTVKKSEECEILKQHQMRMATVQACYQSQEILSFEELRIQRQPELLICVVEEKKNENINKQCHMKSNATTLLHQEGGNRYGGGGGSCSGVVVERQTTSFRAPVHGIGPRSEETRSKFTPSNDRSTDQQEPSPTSHVVCIPPSASFIRRHTLTHLPSKNGFHDFSSLRSKRIQVGQVIQFMTDGSSFRVVQKVGQGGLARVYRATTANNNSIASYAIKVEKPANPWEFYILNELKNRLVNTNDNVMGVLPSRYVIHVHDLYLFKDTSFLIMEYGNQGTLLDCFNNYRNQQRSASMTEPLVMFLTMRLLQAVQSIHNVGIIHGDLKMDNIMLAYNNDNADDDRMDEDEDVNDKHNDTMATTVTDSPENTQCQEKQWQNYPYLVLIDFGRAVDLTLLPSNVTLKADWPVQTTDPLFVRQGISFSPRSIDYYGIAGIAHWLLFGKSMTTTVMTATTRPTGKQKQGQQNQKIQGKLKRYWHVELWQELFDLLLNPPTNNSSASSSIATMIQRGYQILQQDNHLKAYLSQLDPHLQ